jgi:hypothetical protein
MPDQLNPCDLLTSFRFEDGGYRGVLRTRPGKPGLPERVVFWACRHVHAVAGEARSCARAEKDRLAGTGAEIDLTAELDEAEAIVMGSGKRCPLSELQRGVVPRPCGPFHTERQALAAVRDITAAFDADPGPGKMRPLIYAMLTGACEQPGVELGEFDKSVLAGLANHEAQQMVSVAGIITRAYQAGRRRGRV